MVLVIALVVAFYSRQHPQGASYEPTKVTRGGLQVSILATGAVSPENRLEIKPPIAGRVEQVLVEEGQMVKKGDILAWMSSTERAAVLDAARAQGEKRNQEVGSNSTSRRQSWRRSTARSF